MWKESKWKIWRNPAARRRKHEAESMGALVGRDNDLPAGIRERKFGSGRPLAQLFSLSRAAERQADPSYQVRLSDLRRRTGQRRSGRSADSCSAKTHSRAPQT